MEKSDVWNEHGSDLEGFSVLEASHKTLLLPTLPYPALSYPTLRYPPPPYPALPYPTIFYPTLPYPVPPYPTLPYPTVRVYQPYDVPTSGQCMRLYAKRVHV